LMASVTRPTGHPADTGSRPHRLLAAWFKVNSGVLLCAALSQACSQHVRLATGSAVAAAAAGTAATYVLVFAAATINLRGRKRAMRSPRRAAAIAFSSLVSHPIGSCIERIMHERYLAAPPAVQPAAMPSFNASVGLGLGMEPWTSMLLPAPLELAAGVLCWCALFALRLLAFELTFDGLFYVAHRGVHAHPLVYQRVHKLHHAHTHDVHLLSSLQMTAADVLLTHTLPMLGALRLVPIAPGLELAIAKTYLLFQELYGHAGVAHRGRNFGPAPFVPLLLEIELRAEDHQRHHINAACNFSKRFSLFDRLLGTWCPDGAGAKQH